MITMKNIGKPPTICDAVEQWLESKVGEGASNETLRTYRASVTAIGKRIDLGMFVDELTQSVMNKAIARMLDEGLSRQTIQTYVRTLSVFLSFCRNKGWTDETLKKYHAPEAVKPTYSDEDLEKLLRKPNMRRCTFPEYRTWVMISLAMNNGCRSGTMRSILIKDINFDMGYILTRHTKNGKIQSMPMSSVLIEILKEYLEIRKGEPNDYLFCDEKGNQLTQNALRLAVKRYNNKRGVRDTSIHQFRHTFAKKYLLECGGDAFSLQKLMGHSTLEMTKHYCNIYDVELVRNYDARSPLTLMSKKVKGTERITVQKGNRNE